MKSLRVLITNISLSGRSGTETVARDLALGLVRRGHLPIVYSPMLSAGEQRGVAEEIREALVPVTDDLSTIAEPPDIIHGNHLHETMTACLRFPDTPALWVCHSWDGPHDKAPKFPTIKKFLAVDESCLERLLAEEAIPKSKTQLLLNCVDLKRFKPRSQLPVSPRKALLLSHYAAHSAWFETLRSACSQAGLELDAVGAGLEKVSSEPEALMLDYDIVFAVDRTALEATAVGNAVILCGQPGLGPMVKSQICNSLYNQNFGRKWLSEPVTVDKLLERIAEYDPVESQKSSEIIRREASSDNYFEKLMSIYDEVLSGFRQDEDLNNEYVQALQCSSQYMESLSAAVRTHIWGNDEFLQTKIQRDGLEKTAERRRLRLEQLELERHNAATQRDEFARELASLRDERAQALDAQQELNEKKEKELSDCKDQLSRSKAELATLLGSKTMIVKDRIMKTLGLKQ